MELLQRGLGGRFAAEFAATPVAIIEGARAVGKTTFAREMVDRDQTRIIDLSDPEIRRQARELPDDLLAAHPIAPVLVDEIQLVPELVLAIKRRLDEIAKTSQYILTGSTRLKLDQLGGSNPLAGRYATFPLYPFVQAERAGHSRSAVGALFDGDVADLFGTKFKHDDLVRRLEVGGIPTMPGVLDDAAPQPRLLNAYPAAVLSENMVGARTNSADVRQLFELLCTDVGHVINVSRLASELGRERPTIMNHLQYLRDSYLVTELKSYRKNPADRITAHPRVYPLDTGVCAALGNHLPIDLNHSRTGGLLECLVINELIAQASWEADDYRLYYWRENDNREVDLVIERGDGTIVALEIKSSSRARIEDTKGLRALQAYAGPRFLRGFVATTSSTAGRLDDQLWELPIASLWQRR